MSVEADNGRLLLEGVVDSAEERVAACEVAGAVPGVRELDDRLRSADALRPRFQ